MKSFSALDISCAHFENCREQGDRNSDFRRIYSKNGMILIFLVGDAVFPVSQNSSTFLLIPLSALNPRDMDRRAG